MKKVFEYFRLFMIEAATNKIAFFWTLVLPLTFMIVNSMDWFGSPPENYISILAAYWAYLVLITSMNGVGMGLLVYRDNGFLKMFSFLSGSHQPVVLGKIMAQYVFMVVNMLVFTIVVSLLFRLDLLMVLGVGMLTAFFLSIPLFFLALVVPILPVKETAIAPLFSLVIFGFIFFAQMDIRNAMLENLHSILNPAVFLRDSTIGFYQLLSSAEISVSV
ncbi:hypothetical protein [Salimicrobium flavidum]|uniref:ABC-2 type transport system permease protein n=1 Tax=Salimicrobium flavidum TaxID=570947 RepID=A0A1N7J7C2_9BACI|nr:hypothetical protein [Salimicrobium flavidum]SIS45204.1 ABC-2 type transport system permease protein [Salimicrobium flavidum]